MGRRLTTIRASDLACRREDALDAIWEIKNIERTEVKASAVEVHPLDARHGTYQVRGRFAGLPWRGEFVYELNDGGFHSRNADKAPHDATIEGGFIVTPNADGCTVIHYEQYVLPTWLRPLKLLIGAYLRWSMGRELRDLEALVCATTERHRAPDASSRLRAAG